MSKRVFHKTLRRDIIKSFGRFIAIVAIIALGSGFFIGLKVTTSDMMQTEQLYFDTTAFFDYRLLSTQGWEAESVKAVAASDGVLEAEGSVSTDALALIGNEETVLKVMMLPEKINIPELTEGRMPAAPGECVADSYSVHGIGLGSVITISAKNEEDTLELFKEREFTVVGFVRTPQYINFERGTTSIGSGSLAGFLYVLPEAFDTEVFTEIAVRLKEKGFVYSDAYKTLLENAEEPLKDAAQTAADARFLRLWNEAQEELQDGVKEYTDGVIEYSDGIREFEENIPKIAEGADEFTDGEYGLRDGAGQFCEAKRSMQEANVAFRKKRIAGQKALDENSAALDAAEAELIAQRTAVEGLPIPQPQKDAMLREIDSGLGQIGAGRAQLAAGQRTFDRAIAGGWRSLGDGQTELADAQRKLVSGRRELADARAELTEGKRELFEADTELIDARTELRDARHEIARGKQKLLSSLKRPDVYVLSRETNVGYVCYENDANIVSGIAKVFPLFFFAVAALVCVTTTNKLVDEQRGQIGIFKALGYSDASIIGRYLIYTGSASLLGVGIGMMGGSLLFPPVIWTAYGIMYSMPKLELLYDVSLMAKAGGSYLLLSLLVTYFSCRKELREPAAELLRPKAPAPGKQILLERIGFIWKRMKFLHKVSLRNVFRYKKRLIMMMLGIGGCTALLLTGFGLNDSITHLADRQYGEISLYDGLVTFDEDMRGNEQAFLSSPGTDIKSCAFLYGLNADISTAKAGGSVSLRGIESFDELDGLMDFHTAEGTPLKAPGPGGCLISRNLAKKYGLSLGDPFTATVEETSKVTLRVDGIYDNVIYHYIYTSLDTLEPFLEELPLKTAYLSFGEGADAHLIGAALSKAEHVTSVQLTEDMLERVSNMLSSMKYVIALVIGCAGALSFIVLFNLTNINICERIREIATIKVLGFYAGESARYIFRENFILTFCGCLVGVPMGMWLHNYVMAQVQIDMMAFDAIRSPQSYALSVAVTFLFTALVNLFMRPRLDRIKMAESLKSIE